MQDWTIRRLQSRPKCCSESLKWKKASEQRSTNMRPGTLGMSNQEHNRSSQLSSTNHHVESQRFEPFLKLRLNLCYDSTPIHKFTQNSFHINKPDGKHEIIDKQDSAPNMPSPADEIRQPEPNIPHTHNTLEQASSNYNQ